MRPPPRPRGLGLAGADARGVRAARALARGRCPGPRADRLRGRRRPVRIAGTADGLRRGHLGRAADPAQARVRGRSRATDRTARRSAGAGALARPRRGRGSAARRARGPCHRPARRVGAPARRNRRAAAGGRAGPPLAAAERPGAGRAAAGARRLQARQLHRRRGRPGGGDRLGAVPPGRPGRGCRLAQHPLLALRQRRAAGGGSGGAGANSWRRTRPRVGEARPGPGPLLGGLREHEVGGDLRPAGRGPPERGQAKPRARLARPPHLRAGVGHAATDGRRLLRSRPGAA